MHLADFLWSVQKWTLMCYQTISLRSGWVKGLATRDLMQYADLYCMPRCACLNCWTIMMGGVDVVGLTLLAILY